MDIALKEFKHCHLVEVKGRIDSSTAPQFSQTLDGLIDKGTYKIVVDMTNALKPDFSGLLLGHTSSAAEEIQTRAKGAMVVKAFNTIFASLFAKPVSASAHFASMARAR